MPASGASTPQVAGAPEWSLSIVSHGHGPGVARLLADCARWLDPQRFEIIVTLNLPGESVDVSAWRGAVRTLRNAVPAGFAANHDAALRVAFGARFAALDPDLQLRGDPFPALAVLVDDGPPRLAAPRVHDSAGRLQDNARRLLTPLALLRRHLLRSADSYEVSPQPQTVDWIAGLFVAGRRSTFVALGGFDPRYHLYCEDTDLCLRCWNGGGEVWLLPGSEVIHDARRRTLKSATHFLWHCVSLARLWASASFWRFLRRR